MEPPSLMRSVVDLNVLMRRKTVFEAVFTKVHYVVHKELG